MRTKNIGKSELKASVVGLGTWAMGGDFWGKADDEVSIETIRTAMAHGISLIDTAPAYGLGHAEQIVGKAIEGHRKEVVLATKCGLVWNEGDFDPHNCLKYDSVMREIDASLKRLNTDYIDLYQIHWPDPETEIEETVEALKKIVASGKVRYVGVSNFDIGQYDKIKDLMPIASQQIQYSLLYRDQEAIIDEGYKYGAGTLAYGSLSGGVLSGKYKEKPKFSQEKIERRTMFYRAFGDEYWEKSAAFVDELRKIAEGYDRPVGHIAINWVNQQDKISTALVGARTPEQAIQNAEAGNWALTEEDIRTINEAYKRIFG